MRVDIPTYPLQHIIMQYAHYYYRVNFNNIYVDRVGIFELL